MAGAAKRLLIGSAVPLGCAMAALWASPARAESDARIFTPDTLTLTGDVRAVGVGGEQSWIDRGFGKLRSGGDSNGDFHIQPELGNVSLDWQPQFTFALGATVVAAVQGGERTRAGLSEAYLTFKPMRSANLAWSARAGLMWPPVSLEHEGADWHVRDSITPSAINSWIGEEVRPVAVEGSVTANLGQHKLRATGALFAANDTAGTLLTFRGWALHDRTTLAFNRWPLPPLGPEFTGVQAPFTHPLIDLHSGFAHRPGYYAKFSWQPPVPVRIELFHYDNRAIPEDVNTDLEWGWRTRFDNVGLVAELGGGAELRAQALSGRTRMGYSEDGARWIDNRFRSAFVLLTRPVGHVGLALRGEAFANRNRGGWWTDEYDESGWSAMVSAQRSWGPLTAVVELLHVSSNNPSRENAEEAPRQRQTQLQTQLRMRW